MRLGVSLFFFICEIVPEDSGVKSVVSLLQPI